MSANASGTPTSLGIPTLAPTDALVKDGVNEMMQAIDPLIAGRMFSPAAPADKQVVKWNQAGGAWIADYVDPGELKQAGATNGQALLWSTASAKWVPGSASPGVYRKTTAKAVNTSITATDLLNSEITLAAGVLGTTGGLRMHVWGDFLNNTGAGIAAPRFQVVVGGTTVLDIGTSGSWGASASRAAWYVELKCLQLGANSQVWDIVHELAGGGGAVANANSVLTVGNGYYNTASNSGGGGINRGVGENQSAIDMSLARTLVLNVINGTNNALYETRLLGALVEVL